jgi:pimeloyl-ACP methyl ester carboxylesterase
VLYLWIGLGLLLGFLVLCVAGYWYIRQRYMPFVVRIFQEKPLFIIPRGQAVPSAEEVRFPTANGLTLQGCYLKTPAGQRQGVILFGLEFGSNRWACVPYCEHLLANGFDVFTFEFRNQGESDRQPGYEPLQWVTDYEVRDVQAALAYLRDRADHDPRGVGFFGISKGGSAGLVAAADDPYVRCCVTDGVFATRSTMMPYMRKWAHIYTHRYFILNVLPDWVYAMVGRAALKQIRRQRRCRFPHLERALPRIAPRPLLMIHGGADTYIKPEMAQDLFEMAQEPKELWLVEGAKHNQSLALAGEEYRQRVLEFFQTHLGGGRSLKPSADLSVRPIHRLVSR